MGDQFMKEIVDQHWAIIKPVKRWLKQGFNLAPEDNPRYAVENMLMQGAEAEWLITRVHHDIIRELEKVGLNWDNFGFYRLLKRVSVSPDAQKAAPRGVTAEWAEKKLTELRVEQWAGQKWETIERVSDSLDKLRLELIEKIEAQNIYPKDIIKTMKDAGILLEGLRDDGKKILEGEGGRDKYKEMIRKKYGLIDTDIPEIPSIEKIKEFRKIS